MNRDLWERMIIELARHRVVTTQLVRGHAGHEANERADRLAVDAARDAEPRRTAPLPADVPPPRPLPWSPTRSSSASICEARQASPPGLRGPRPAARSG